MMPSKATRRDHHPSRAVDHGRRSAAATAFVSTKSRRCWRRRLTDWLVNHLQDKDWYTPEEHQNTLSFMFGIGVDDVFQRKDVRPLVIAQRNEQDELVSAAVVYEYDRSVEKGFRRTFMKHWRELKSFGIQALTRGRPELLSNKQYREDFQHFEQKADSTMASLPKWHQKFGPEQKHWYVFIVGVGPEHKGKGYGGELMTKISSLADEAGKLLYLESGVKNKTFYERMGYEVLAKHTLSDPYDTSREPAEAYVMTRKPRSSLPATHQP